MTLSDELLASALLQPVNKFYVLGLDRKKTCIDGEIYL